MRNLSINHSSGLIARLMSGGARREVVNQINIREGGSAMRAMVVAMVVGAGLLGVGQKACAATSDGTLITNVASATFSTASLNQYFVSYNATATVLVQNPCVTLIKTPDVTVQAAGGSVTYNLWVVNCSPNTSAFNITVTDKLPDNIPAIA